MVGENGFSRLTFRGWIVCILLIVGILVNYLKDLHTQDEDTTKQIIAKTEKTHDDSIALARQKIIEHQDSVITEISLDNHRQLNRSLDKLDSQLSKSTKNLKLSKRLVNSSIEIVNSVSSKNSYIYFVTTELNKKSQTIRLMAAGTGKHPTTIYSYYIF